MITLCRNGERLHSRRGASHRWDTVFAPPAKDDGAGHGFGPLVSLEECWLAPGEGTAFSTGVEAEVVTLLRRGAVGQEDSAGGSEVLHAGEVQRRTAGGRVRQQEMNASHDEQVQLFRISLDPMQVGLARAHEQQLFTAAQRRNGWCAVASTDGRRGSLRMLQDALIYACVLDPGRHLFYDLSRTRSAWLHIVVGSVTIGEVVLTDGDGIGLVDEPAISLTAGEKTELLLVKLGTRSAARGAVEKVA